MPDHDTNPHRLSSIHVKSQCAVAGGGHCCACALYVLSTGWLISGSGLTEQRIQSALHGADQVSHLWTHDLVFERPLMPAAVLVLLVASDAGYQVVLTTRAQHLRHHPGRLALWVVVWRWETVEEAALREAFEEIHLDIERVNVLGVMPNYQTISGFP